MSYSREGGALVTGGTSGIGRAIVERLAAEGIQVAFTGRNGERGLDVAAGTGAAFIPADAADRDACDRSVEEALAVLGGRLTALVCNASIVFEAPLGQTPDHVLREIVEVDLTAPFRYSRACFGLMRGSGGGSIVHVASDAAIRGIHKLAAYSVAKAGIVALTELLAAEGAPHAIRANAICPGATAPGVQATPRGYEDHAEDRSGWEPHPSGRFGTGDDVASLAAWLVSAAGERVSGATIRVDGGAAAATRGVFAT